MKITYRKNLRFFGVLSTILGIALMLMVILPGLALANPDSIWTTDTTNDIQQKNFYDPGEGVYLRAEGLTANTTYSWNIEELGGGGNPSWASGNATTDANGNITGVPALQIWTIPDPFVPTGNGVLKITMADKHKTFQVNAPTSSTTTTTTEEGTTTTTEEGGTTTTAATTTTVAAGDGGDGGVVTTATLEIAGITTEKKHHKKAEVEVAGISTETLPFTGGFQDVGFIAGGASTLFGSILLAISSRFRRKQK